MKLYCSPRSEQTASESAYALLNTAFRLEYGEKLPIILKTANGKPYFPERPEICFSLSHSKTHVLCGLSFAPIGVDIESPRRISERVKRLICSSEEIELFDPLDLWVLKESYIKLHGATISMMKTLRFSREGGKIITPDNTIASGLYRVGDCRAAVCAKGDNPAESIALI